MTTLVQHLRRAELARVSRRHFLHQCGAGLGAAWAALAASPRGRAADGAVASSAPRAKRVIFLHMAGAPSQLELFERKPELAQLDGQDCPESLLQGKRFAFIRGVPQLLGPQYKFAPHGQSGAWVSDRLPHFAKTVDKVCFIRTMQTDQFNHGPAQLLVHTGNQNPGYAAMGSWATYGLGSENENLPGFVVLLSGGHFPDAGKSVWGSAFLPGAYQGVQCRSAGEPVLFLDDPAGISRPLRRKFVDAIAEVDRLTHAETGDPETVARIAQYEMAFRMQMSATEAMALADEPPAMHELYGTEPGRESLANNCLLARRLVERGVRFVQLFDWGWDSHGAAESEALDAGFKTKCRQLDRPVAALLTDLDQRGLLDDTLVVWSGEFGRTPMRENRGGAAMKFVGRDHHPYAYTIWLAGGGVKAGFSYGETDPIGFFPVGEPVQVRDLHATILALLGIDHEKLTYPFQGLDQKLTGVKPARVLREVMA